MKLKAPSTKEKRQTFLLKMTRSAKKDLCLAIAKSEYGKDVVNILKKEKLWDEDNWKELGGNSAINTHSVVGNQQSNPANALLEKLINCGDSSLMLKVKEKNIQPSNDNYPQNVKEAMINLFNVDDGNWINVSASKRTEIAEEYCGLVATGEKKQGAKPTFTVIDKAEGQNHTDFEDTFLSLTKNNKVKIPFVQGKFGMGSHGALPFCSCDGLQLILSKRNPLLGDGDGKWGFTLIRKVEPTEQYRNSRWMYLRIDEEIPSFEADDLNLYPGKYPNPYGESFKYGTFIKMYDFDTSGMATNITLDLYNKLNTLLVNPVIPARLYERRAGFNANSAETTLFGLNARLASDRSDVIGFQAGFRFNVEDQPFSGHIYAFNKYRESTGKPVSMKNYGEGVLFTINGQTNGFLPRRFFSKKSVGYELIAKNLIVTIDCSEVSNKFIEKLFKSNREQLYENDFTNRLKEEIEYNIRNNAGLKEFANKWRQNEIARRTEDQTEFKNILSKLISNKPYIAKILNIGGGLTNPFNEGGEEEISEFNDSFFPTFFELTKKYNKDRPRETEETRKARIELSTDAPNDYLTRPKDSGSFKFSINDKDITNATGVALGGSNGKWFLTVPPLNEEENKCVLEITDVQRIEPFRLEFYLKKVKKTERPTGEPRKSKKKNNLSIPDIIEIHKEDWEENDMQKEHSLKVIDGENPLFYANMDNIYLKNYLKGNPQETQLINSQYKTALALLGLIMKTEHKENDGQLSDYSLKMGKVIAPILMPLIRDID